MVERGKKLEVDEVKEGGSKDKVSVSVIYY